MSSTLSNYKSSGKSDSHYTMYFYNMKVIEIINFMKSKLDFINKSIKDSYKRKMANNIIYDVKCQLENNFNETDNFSQFILANEKTVHFIPFNSNDKSIIREWKMQNYMFEFSERFKIVFLTKLFAINFNIMVHHFDNKDVTIKLVDFYKEKTLIKTSTNSYEDEIKNYSSKFVIYTGLSSYLNNLKPDNYIKKKQVTNDMIIELYETIIENINVERIKTEIFGNLTNEKVNHKFIFGKKDISNGITNMIIKTLYIDYNVFRKLKNKLEKTNNLNLLNFEIITFKNSEVLKDYDYMVAEKYY